MAIYMQAYLDLLQALTDRCIFLGTFRKYGEYDNENPDLILHRRSAYYINKLIKRCEAAEENAKYFEEELIKERKQHTHQT